MLGETLMPKSITHENYSARKLSETLRDGWDE